MASSQNLTPKVILRGQDTLFCFNMGQSRAIAKKLVQGLYCDSLLLATEEENMQLCKLQSISDSSALLLKTKNSNQQVIMLNQQNKIEGMNLRLDLSEKKFNNQRMQKEFFLALSLVFGTCLFLK